MYETLLFKQTHIALVLPQIVSFSTFGASLFKSETFSSNTNALSGAETASESAFSKICRGNI